MSPVDVIVACSCSHLGHAVRFTYFPLRPGDPEAFEAYVDVTLDHELSFWRRLKVAWRDLTKRVCGYGDCAEVILRPEDLPKIRSWLDLAERDAARRGPP
jgi:hypothetical protein